VALFVGLGIKMRLLREEGKLELAETTKQKRSFA
jgi:hypothetical protein